MKKSHQIMLLALVLAGAGMLGDAPIAAAQTTKWVDQTNGNDSNDGNSEATAYASLQFALDHSVSGTAAARSLIHVKGGVHGAAGLTNPNGARTAILIRNLDYVTIQAVAGHYPMLKPRTDGVVSLSAVNCRHLTIAGLISVQTGAQSDHWQMFNVRDLTVRHCVFEGGQRGIKFCTALRTATLEQNLFNNITALDTGDALEFLEAACSGVRIQDNLFHDNTRHIRLQAQAGQTIADFVIRRNFIIGTPGEEGVRLIGAQNVVLENNIVIYAAQQGLFIDAGCRDITVRHNTFYRNRFEAIRTVTAAADIVIKNNILYGNGTYAALAAPVSSLPGADYNLIYHTGSATESAMQPAVTAFGANSRIGSDPLFVCTIRGEENLYLQDNSPALAMGADLGVGEDIERFPRPLPRSTRPDVGAYESPLPHPAIPIIAVTPGAHHFGELKIGATRAQTIVVSNLGNRDLQVRRSVLVGDNAAEFALLSGKAPFTLAPGASRELAIGFTPKSLGAKSVTLELHCDDPDHSPFLVRLSGVGGLPGLAVAVEHNDSKQVPAGFVLEQNYPNPFGCGPASLVSEPENSHTTIRFTLPTTAQVTLQVFDARGALVTTLVAGRFTAGRHELRWHGRNVHGQPLASGMYCYRLTAGRFSQTRQMLLVR